VALTETQLQAVRAALEERRDGFRERVEELGRAPEPGATIGFGKRIGDGTTEAISRLTDIGVGRSAESALARVTRALEKLDEGTYGVCDVCGTEISSARLEAMPDSVLCITCAAAAADTPGPRR
jgi:DnaK suppressor protein